MARFTAWSSATLLSLFVTILALTGSQDDRDVPVQAMRIAASGVPPSPSESPSSTSGERAPSAATYGDDGESGSDGSGRDDAGDLELASNEVCVDAGYLCAQLDRAGSLRVLRFPADLEAIRVHVPLPDHEPEGRATALRDAAVAGLRAWSSRPFMIRFVDDPEEEDVDLVVQWEAQLPDGGLGETRSSFRKKDGVARYRIAKLALATRNPYDADLRLRPADVELTAAHEMGHALGLPHSDDRGDLMYPTDAAKSLSERDFLTLEALYRIPVGATIVKAPDRDGRFVAEPGRSSIGR